MHRISATALDHALDHVIHRGDTDILPVPFEYRAIQHDWTQIKDYLLSQDLHAWQVRPLRRCLSPKQQLGLRIATQLDPLDTLIITALIFEAGPEIEAARLPPQDRQVHSYRFSPGDRGQLYDPGWNFDSFRKRSLELASTASYKFVVQTDIADFYPRIYAHRMENALHSVTSSDIAQSVFHMLHDWNPGVSYGVPVGPAAVRILTEVLIDDVDQTLVAEGVAFCRYSDDYRLFATSERKAREALALLATVLFKSHGLTIQEGKTELWSAEDFIARYSPTEQDEERSHLSQWLEFLLGTLDIGEYELVDHEALTADQQQRLMEHNLWDIVLDRIHESGDVSPKLVNFALRRIAQLGLPGDGTLILRNIRQFRGMFREALVAAVAAVDGVVTTPNQLKALGGDLLSLLDAMTVGHLPYHRAWILQPFGDSADWNNSDRFVRIYNTSSDSFTRTAAIMAMGRAKLSFWFRPRKQDLDQFGPWERRAFLFGASCMEPDETVHWYRSVKSRLDVLEQTVVKYARSYPMR